MISFSQNNILATGSPDGTIILWEKDKRKKIGKLPELVLPSSKNFSGDIVDADFCRFSGSLM